MKLPALVAFGFFLILPLLIGGYVRTARSDGLDAGSVMGRDFTHLLGDKGVTLRVRADGDDVTFTWSSRDADRMQEVREMGEYMMAMKRYLESKTHDPVDTDLPSSQIRVGQR